MLWMDDEYNGILSYRIWYFKLCGISHFMVF
jgi:hypothetical protein